MKSQQAGNDVCSAPSTPPPLHIFGWCFCSPYTGAAARVGRLEVLADHHVRLMLDVVNPRPTTHKHPSIQRCLSDQGGTAAQKHQEQPETLRRARRCCHKLAVPTPPLPSSPPVRTLRRHARTEPCSPASCTSQTPRAPEIENEPARISCGREACVALRDLSFIFALGTR